MSQKEKEILDIIPKAYWNLFNRMDLKIVEFELFSGYNNKFNNHFEVVFSNDTLYQSDFKKLAEFHSFCNIILSEKCILFKDTEFTKAKYDKFRTPIWEFTESQINEVFNHLKKITNHE